MSLCWGMMWVKGVNFEGSCGSWMLKYWWCRVFPVQHSLMLCNSTSSLKHYSSTENCRRTPWSCLISHLSCRQQEFRCDLQILEMLFGSGEAAPENYLLCSYGCNCTSQWNVMGSWQVKSNLPSSVTYAPHICNSCTLAHVPGVEWSASVSQESLDGHSKVSIHCFDVVICFFGLKPLKHGRSRSRVFTSCAKMATELAFWVNSSSARETSFPQVSSGERQDCRGARVWDSPYYRWLTAAGSSRAL